MAIAGIRLSQPQNPILEQGIKINRIVRVLPAIRQLLFALAA
jgi:hypothetical protein